MRQGYASRSVFILTAVFAVPACADDVPQAAGPTKPFVHPGLLYDPETETDTAREQINVITTWLDGSSVYGSDDATALALRTLSGGRLKTSEGDLLPFNNAETFPDGTLAMDNDAGIVPDEELFAAGDVRANENIELTSMHTLFVREHNRLADEIADGDPSLTDEEIYQQARAIVIGELQAITYNEWLPSIFGTDALSRYTGYDSTVDPTIVNEFSTAAFRFGHSLLGSMAYSMLPTCPVYLRSKLAMSF